MRRLLISFSGGETSAFMAQWLLANARDRYDDIKVLFANTGQENEETLRFVEKCDLHFGLKVVWIEAVLRDRGVGADEVDFVTASRKGEPFERIISRYGIPNYKFRHCTRALKLRPINAYMRSIGWKAKSYDTAIGIRSDEIDRMSASASEHRIIYPLIRDVPMTKPQINAWWAKQPFRLGLKGYEGNCTWCWKKSLRKHFTLLSERPEIYEFPERMERLYGHVGPEFRKNEIPGYRRVFFRGSRSVSDLKALYEDEKDRFTPAEDDAVIFDERLDIGAGCEESCEVFSDESLETALEDEQFDVYA